MNLRIGFCGRIVRTVGGRSGASLGDRQGGYVFERAGNCERSCEPSVFRILGWMHVTGSTNHLQAVTADNCHNILVLQNTLCYIIAVCEETRRQEM